MIIPKDYEELAQYLETGTNIFYFTATWCGDCNFLKPQLPAIEAEHPEFTFIAVDRDQFLDLAIKWGIMGIPSFVVVRDGQEIGRYVDKLRKTKEQVDQFIDSLN